MQDAWRAYLELALGATEASKKKAQKVAKKLVGKGGATAAQLQAIAEDVVAASAANREALTKLVRAEVDRALGAVGLAKADDVAELEARVEDLETELRQARARAAAAEVAAGNGPVADGVPALKAVAAPAPAKKAVAVKKAVAKKAVAKKTVAKKAVAAKAPGDLAALPTPGAAAPTGATPAKKAPARKAPARKAPARKTTPGPAGPA
jgi:polyhydroxyalkanoate synthesis regulator phasin